MIVNCSASMSKIGYLLRCSSGYMVALNIRRTTSSSKVLDKLDNFCAFLELDNHRLRLLLVLHDSNHRVGSELGTLVTNGLELKESSEVLHFSFDRVVLGIEDKYVTETGKLVVDEAVSAHDHNLATVQHGDSWTPPREKACLREVYSLPLAHSLKRTSGVDHILDRVERSLAARDSTEHIDCAVHSTGTSCTSCHTHRGHSFPDIVHYVKSFARANGIATKGEDMSKIKLAHCELRSCTVHGYRLARNSTVVYPSAILSGVLSLEEIVSDLYCRPALFATDHALARNLFSISRRAYFNNITRVSQVEVQRCSIGIVRCYRPAALHLRLTDFIRVLQIIVLSLRAHRQPLL